MRSIGIVLGVIVAGLAAYIGWGLLTGSGVANASSAVNTFARNSGSNAQGSGPLKDPKTGQAYTTGVFGAINAGQTKFAVGYDKKSRTW